MRLEIRDVTKTYGGGRAALAGVSINVDRGLHGLLGPNGAGKTTLMKIVATLLQPSSGRVLADGADVLADRTLVRHRLGYLGQEWGAPRNARCSEIVDLVLRLRGVHDGASRRAEVRRLLGLVGLADLAARKVKTLSGGMMRRLGVAQALAGDPEVIIMDEPTVGLDPHERVEFRQLLTHLGRERTIILSTHVVADVGTTCERVTVLDRGRVQYDGAPREFAAKANGKVFEVVVADQALEARLREAMTVVATAPTAAGHRFRVVGDPLRGVELVPVEPNLEDAYLLLVGVAGAEGLEPAA
jgi:ABC-type multidrug transport system ATPase subunit